MPRDFLNTFNYNLRVAEASCPPIFTQAFVGAICYRHGYDTFFDFKEKSGLLLLDPSLGGSLGYWRVVPIVRGDLMADTFQLQIQARAGARFTVIYLDRWLLLQPRRSHR